MTSTLIKADRVFDGHSMRSNEPLNILVRDGRIAGFGVISPEDVLAQDSNCTFIDRSSADVVAAADAFVVPTLSIVGALLSSPLNLPAPARSKLAEVGGAAGAAVEHCAAAGVRLGFGTDLFGTLRNSQCDEFVARARIQAPLDVLRSATTVNAEILGLTGEIGTIAPGAAADLIAVAGDPATDIAILARPEVNQMLLMRAGRVIVNRTTAEGALSRRAQ